MSVGGLTSRFWMDVTIQSFGIDLKKLGTSGWNVGGHFLTKSHNVSSAFKKKVVSFLYSGKAAKIPRSRLVPDRLLYC